MARFSEALGGGDGFRVSIVTRPGSRFYHLEVRRKDPKTGAWKREQQSLNTEDLAVARSAGHGLLAAIGAEDPALLVPRPAHRPTNLERAARPVGRLTWGQLIERYRASAAFTALEPKTQYQYDQAFAIILEYVDPGTKTVWADLDVLVLDQEKLDAFTAARMSGRYAHPRCRPGPCGPSTVRNHFVALKAAASWAYRTKDTRGARLIPDRVFDGLTLPEEKNPAQPVMADDWFERLYALAHKWPHSRAKVRHFKALLLMGEAFGNRVNGILHLQWTDIDFDGRTLAWNPDFDKMEQGRSSPIPDDVLEVLRELYYHPARPKESPWVFWSRTAPESNISYDTALSWLVKAFPIALGIEKPKMLGYHSLRRKWKTDRGDLNLKAVMDAAGWKSMSSALRYDKPSREALETVINHGRRERGVTTPDENLVNNLVTPYERDAERRRQVVVKRRLT